MYSNAYLNFALPQFYTYELLTASLGRFTAGVVHDSMLLNVCHFLCGSLAGCTATAVTQPLDVLRARFIAQGEPKIYT